MVGAVQSEDHPHQKHQGMRYGAVFQQPDPWRIGGSGVISTKQDCQENDHTLVALFGLSLGRGAHQIETLSVKSS